MEVAERRDAISLSPCPIGWVSGCSLSRLERFGLTLFQMGHCLWVSAAGHTVGHNEMLLLFSIQLSFFQSKSILVPSGHSSRCLLQGLLVITSKFYRPWGRGRWVWRAGLSLATSPLCPVTERRRPHCLEGSGEGWRVCPHGGYPACGPPQITLLSLCFHQSSPLPACLLQCSPVSLSIAIASLSTSPDVWQVLHGPKKF